jgi:hypothetical protein
MTKKLKPKNNSNKEYHRAYAAAYYKKNRDKIKKQTNKYRKNHLKEYALYYASYGKKQIK